MGSVQYRSDVIISPTASNKTRRGILHRLKPFKQCVGDVVQQRVAVVQTNMDDIVTKLVNFNRVKFGKVQLLTFTPCPVADVRLLIYLVFENRMTH
jgi:hypothetical protein